MRGSTGRTKVEKGAGVSQPDIWFPFNVLVL